MTVDINMLDPLCEGPSPQAIEWTHIIVHHTAGEEENTEQIRRDHLRLGWRDIGYHWVIEKDGKVVPGRLPTLPGAHALGWNSKALGVVLVGNFEIRYPYPSQLLSLQGLLVRLMAEHRRIIPGNILPHDRVAATKCPGKLFNLTNLNPLMLVVNGKVASVPVRILPPGQTEMLIAGQWVPVRAVAEAWGGAVKWSAVQRTITVTV